MIFSNEYLDMVSNSVIHKGKVDKSDFIKIKNFCSAKNTINRMQRPATN